MLFYKPGYYAAHPLEIFAVWKGGMSFHGGLLGVIVAIALFARARAGGRSSRSPTSSRRACRSGFAAGRIGNFINGELWGRLADPSLPWAMVFPQSGSPLPRHPSQLYQFALEGLLLFVAALDLRARSRAACGQVSGAFLVGYGVLRFIAEYFREPDELPRPARARHEHGPVAVRADDRRRAGAVALGPRPRRRATPAARCRCRAEGA